MTTRAPEFSSSGTIFSAGLELQCADVQRREVGEVELAAAVEHQADDVAGAHAQSGQTTGDPGDAIRHLPVSGRFFRTERAQGDAIGVGPGGDLKSRAQRGLRECLVDARHCALLLQNGWT
jgi:hypothetical protein